MLIAFSQLDGTQLQGTDDSIGTLKDVFLSDDDWTVRYLVVDTGGWFSGRRVLVSPSAITARNWGMRNAAVKMTQQQVESGPDIDFKKPVSRQMELELAAHYDWPVYWAGGYGVGGAAMLPPASVVPHEKQHEIEDRLSNLRSASEVNGYYIQATDGDIGHVEELIIDDETWIVRYLVIDTKNWLPARKVLIAPDWIEAISWTDKTVEVNLTRQAIKDSPEYYAGQPVNRGYEERLYDFYGRQSYWL